MGQLCCGGTTVTFVYSDWIQQYPQFVNISQTLVEGDILTTAEQFCRNDGRNPVCNPTLLLTMLNLMVAHLCQLFYPPNQPAGQVGQVVGRMSDAREGSVAVQFDFPTPSNMDVAWYSQTPYGLAFYKLMPKTGRYFPMTYPYAYGRRWLNPWPGGLSR